MGHMFGEFVSIRPKGSNCGIPTDIEANQSSGHLPTNPTSAPGARCAGHPSQKPAASTTGQHVWSWRLGSWWKTLIEPIHTGDNKLQSRDWVWMLWAHNFLLEAIHQGSETSSIPNRIFPQQAAVGRPGVFMGVKIDKLPYIDQQIFPIIWGMDCDWRSLPFPLNLFFPLPSK